VHQHGDPANLSRHVNLLKDSFGLFSMGRCWMPIFEMPLADLRTYDGRNPKPADFDAYWASALNELAGTDPIVELRRADFQAPFADCFDLYFTGVGGARIHAMYLRPTGKSAPLPCLLRFHGYSNNSGDWYDKLGHVASGQAIAAMDCRGQGGSSEDVSRVSGSTFHGHIIRGLQDDPERLLFRQIYLDTVQLARIVMSFEEIDPQRIGVTGASQGGGLSLACAALEPRVKMAAPIYPFLCDFRRVWEMDLAKGAYEELTTFFRLHDPLHVREDDAFMRLGYIDVQHLAERIQARVLLLLAMMDTVCPPSTQFAAYNRIRSPKEMVIYSDYGHEALPGSGDRIFQFFAGL
jgi:cephalosporin-C deacetylase